MSQSQCPCCFIVPPYLLEKLAKSENPKIRESALATLRTMALVSATRAAMTSTIRVAAPPLNAPKSKVRRVFDCENTTDLSRRRVMSEGDPASTDVAVREAYDYSGVVWDFFNTVFHRNSIDDRGMTMVSSVHYSETGGGFDNAFWDTRQMVYGDGGEYFDRMTKCLDVVAHELTHGITQYSAGLPYENQSGALNEHFSDVFGVVVRQWHENQTNPATANWLIGDGLLLTGGALRSMKAPGEANPDDIQPRHMRDYQRLPNTPAGDYGGVHINSGIPNHAFYLAATAIGRASWEVAGRIWYIALTERLKGAVDFARCAYETISVARDYFDDKTASQVAAAWMAVGVLEKKIGPLASLKITKVAAVGGQKGKPRKRAA